MPFAYASPARFTVCGRLLLFVFELFPVSVVGRIWVLAPVAAFLHVQCLFHIPRPRGLSLQAVACVAPLRIFAFCLALAHLLSALYHLHLLFACPAFVTRFRHGHPDRCAFRQHTNCRFGRPVPLPFAVCSHVRLEVGRAPRCCVQRSPADFFAFCPQLRERPAHFFPFTSHASCFHLLCPLSGTGVQPARLAISFFSLQLVRFHICQIRAHKTSCALARRALRPDSRLLPGSFLDSC